MQAKDLAIPPYPEEDMTAQKRERNIAIVLSAGRGTRMNTGIPKQYLDLNGMPVIAWSLRAFELFEGVDDVILVTSKEDIEYCRCEVVEKYGFSKVRSIVSGGAERYLSVWEGLKEAKRCRMDSPDLLQSSDQNPESFCKTGNLQPADSGEGHFDYVFIHDGARPLIDEPILQRALEDVRTHKACVVGMPVKDTIKIADQDAFAKTTPDRRFLWQVQTPQVFAFPLVYGSYRKLIEEGIQNVTDDAMVVERESSTRVRLTEGSYRNIKITTPEDLEIAKLFLRE